MELHDNVSDFPKNIHIENEDRKLRYLVTGLFILV